MSSSTSSSSSSELVASSLDESATPFAVLLDVRVPINVVLGTGSISVRECLGLAPRSVVRLKQAAGEDVLLMAGDVSLARAEVVIVEDSTAVRLTEILKAVSSEE